MPDTEVLERAGFHSIHTLLQKTQVRWTGHVVRMSDNRVPKQLLYGELQRGKRSVGGQKKRYKDCLKASLKSFGVNLNSWELLACDRANWRSQITSGASAAEKRRTAEAQRKRAERKARAASTSTDVPGHKCPTCERVFRARIGLISHLRTHRSSSNP